MIPKKKIVLYPIKVPAGNYCWEGKPPYTLCEHFDNEGGHARCTLGFYEIKDTKDGILKADECAKFKDG